MMTTSSNSSVAVEWDHLRAAFASSLLVDTSLHSLAQNLDGLAWPISGGSETPGVYVDLTYAELCLELAARGQPRAADVLVRILRETLAFDAPFGEMIKQTEAAAERDNPFLRSLERLGIPADFPLTLCSLDAPARDLCMLEEIETLGHLALFAQRLAQGVIIGGDLKRLLDALAQPDEAALAELVPTRVGTKGVHLAEALAHAAASSNPGQNVATAVAWFDAEASCWRTELALDRGFLERQLAVLDDPAFTQTVLHLLIPHFGDYTAKPKPWTRLTRWFRR
jgi:hypothetical protein